MAIPPGQNAGKGQHTAIDGVHGRWGPPTVVAHLICIAVLAGGRLSEDCSVLAFSAVFEIREDTLILKGYHGMPEFPASLGPFVFRGDELCVSFRRELRHVRVPGQPKGAWE